VIRLGDGFRSRPGEEYGVAIVHDQGG
jgi:hypothetical protein